MYPTQIEYTDLAGDTYTDIINIQVLAKKQTKLDLVKNFLWIFDYKDFSVKNIVELSDYEINIDEETNSTSILKILKNTNARARDLIMLKKNNKVVYWGIINEIQKIPLNNGPKPPMRISNPLFAIKISFSSTVNGIFNSGKLFP